MTMITKEKLREMMNEFMAVHVEGERDFIGPNATDAPFFAKFHENMNEWDYLEAADRFYKYRNTQIPWLADKVGVPMEDAEAFLEAMKERGEQAQERKKFLDDAYRDAYDAGYYGRDSYPEYKVLNDWRDLGGVDEAEYEAYLEAYAEGIKAALRSRELMTVKASLYEDIWYGRNDREQRWPKKSTRVKVIFQRNAQCKDELKGRLGFPSIKWNGEFWSLAPLPDVVANAVTVFQKHGYFTHELEALTLPEQKKANVVSKVSATVEGQSIVLKWPWLQDDDLRARVMAIVKGVMGRKWDAKRKAWLVPLSQGAFLQGRLTGVYDSLANAIKALPELATVVEKTAERIAISGASELKDEEVISQMRSRLAEQFPEGRELYPFQYVGVRFVELSNGRALIGDDMGIGKTIQALAYIALHPENHPALMVCPANVKFNWLKEAKAWLPNLTSAVVESGKSDIPDTDIVVINYDLMKKQQVALEKRGFNIVVFDESHYLKNVKAQRTQASLSVARASTDIICLSGTAITNRPLEFFTTLNLLRPAEFGNFFAFAKRYTDAHHNGYGWDFNGSSNEEELHERTRSVGIRRLKKEVMAELPDKIRQIVEVHPSRAERKEYQDIQSSWLSEYQMHKASNSLPAGFVLNMLTELRHHAGRLKINATADWVREYRDLTGKPVVVFAHHRDVIEMLSEELSEFRLGFITGEVNAQKRQAMVDQFQAGELDVLVCSTIAAKEGLTLTAADTVVFVEREWVPGWEEQAEDRVNRIGQDAETVHAIYLSVKGTIDEKFDAVIEEKRAVVQAILDGGTIEERGGIAKALLEAMVEAGDLPEDMLNNKMW